MRRDQGEAVAPQRLCRRVLQTRPVAHIHPMPAEGAGQGGKVGARARPAEIDAQVRALAGALLLVLADTAARLVAVPAEVPVGILTALIGGPAFLLLLRGVARQQGGHA